MSLLTKAMVEQAAAKVGIFGKQGSGKTTTAVLLAIGLSKTYHDGAPVAFFDTENGSDYVVPIFKAEGVECYVVKSRAFVDMREAEREAKALKCCAFIPDSYTHPWGELQDSIKKRLNRQKLEFHHMQELKMRWTEWTDQMLSSPLHMLLCGRLGYDWDREEDTVDGQGRTEKGDLVKLGTKMKGEADAGYEPSLLVEMEALQSAGGREKKTRAKKSSITHFAYVSKDRWRTLNGQRLTFKDLNHYKAGDYKAVFNAFRPHFDQLAIGKVTQRAVDGTRTSQGLFDARDGAAFGRRKDIALEEIAEALTAVWPGQTKDEKRAKQICLETLFGTMSWTKVTTCRLEDLEAMGAVLQKFREQAKNDTNVIASGEAGIVALLEMCKSDVLEPAEAESTDDDVPARMPGF